jgi:hypothetical protein
MCAQASVHECVHAWMCLCLWCVCILSLIGWADVVIPVQMFGHWGSKADPLSCEHWVLSSLSGRRNTENSGSGPALAETWVWVTVIWKWVKGRQTLGHFLQQR